MGFRLFLIFEIQPAWSCFPHSIFGLLKGALGLGQVNYIATSVIKAVGLDGIITSFFWAYQGVLSNWQAVWCSSDLRLFRRNQYATVVCPWNFLWSNGPSFSYSDTLHPKYFCSFPFCLTGARQSNSCKWGWLEFGFEFLFWIHWGFKKWTVDPYHEFLPTGKHAYNPPHQRRPIHSNYQAHS